jgi:1,4-dihydroxy-2-naphthoyl-CoA synthase
MGLMIDYSVEDSVAFIRLNRPEKLNALTNEGIEELAAALRRFDHDDTAAVGVLHGGRALQVEHLERVPWRRARRGRIVTWAARES